ncbi:NADPH-dependent F420 reductase [Aeromonas veronii]
MKIAFIGFGNVGAPLADHLQRVGHEVLLATNNPNSDSVTKALALNSALKVMEPRSAVSTADIVFLATPYEANAAALEVVAEEIKGKVIVDCTNPVGPNLSHGLNNVRSGAEEVQSLAPYSFVVKAFTIYGYENFQNNSYPTYNVKPVMMFCGDDDPSKQKVSSLIRQLEWEPLDVGGLPQALHLEHMTLLWVRMVRVNGASPNMVWAALKR